MGTGMERTHVAMVGPRLAECGTNGAGSLTTSRPCGLHWRTDKPDKQQGAKQTAQPRAPAQGNKASNL